VSNFVLFSKDFCCTKKWHCCDFVSRTDRSKSLFSVSILGQKTQVQEDRSMA
jgi:hypothetical protein